VAALAAGTVKPKNSTELNVKEGNNDGADEMNRKVDSKHKVKRIEMSD